MTLRPLVSILTNPVSWQLIVVWSALCVATEKEVWLCEEDCLKGKNNNCLQMYLEFAMHNSGRNVLSFSYNCLNIELIHLNECVFAYSPLLILCMLFLDRSVLPQSAIIGLMKVTTRKGEGPHMHEMRRGGV